MNPDSTIIKTLLDIQKEQEWMSDQIFINYWVMCLFLGFVGFMLRNDIEKAINRLKNKN